MQEFWEGEGFSEILSSLKPFTLAFFKGHIGNLPVQRTNSSTLKEELSLWEGMESS